MKIESVTVKNYRNIDGISVTFNPESNFIIGENNLGKSNFLTLLSTVCSGKGVDEHDFSKSENPVEVELNITLNQYEQGFFEDNFSPEDSSLLKILYTQAINDAYPTIICVDTNESINPHQIRKLNFLKYETTSIPSRELRLDTKKGTGLLISSMIDRYNEGKTSEFLNDKQIDDLKEFINERLEKIHCFRYYSLKATIAPHPTEMLTGLFFLSDGNRKIEATGSGIQYMAMATINILCQIMELYRNKTTSFSDLLYTDESGQKILPIILAIDEPEVHLHPYLQRSLIKYYRKILSNGDSEFLDLIKDCFDIDGINGQLIIVTHSTDAFAGDYRNLIRFYKKENMTKVVSGYTLRPIPGKAKSDCINEGEEKHLIMRFPEIKEAFYSKCAILIEGETEYGCIHAFAEKMGVSLDDFGICVINAGGQNSIKPLRQLLKLFRVPSIAIYDGDVKHGSASDSDEFYTEEPCFEIEIVKAIFSGGNADIIRKIARDLDSHAEDKVLDYDYLKNPFKKIGIYDNKDDYNSVKLSDLDDTNEKEFCQIYSAWFIKNKGVLLGRIVGYDIFEEDIPACYRNAIIRAQEVAINE